MNFNLIEVASITRLELSTITQALLNKFYTHPMKEEEKYRNMNDTGGTKES